MTDLVIVVIEGSEFVACEDRDPCDPTWDHADCPTCDGTKLIEYEREPYDEPFGGGDYHWRPGFVGS